MKKLLSALLLMSTSAMADCRYTYDAFVTSVYDADTITVTIDLGFKTKIEGEKIRFNRINAPEMRGPEKAKGTIARNWLRSRILGEKITLRTLKDKKGKYGRYLGEIYLGDTNINDELVRRGYAVYKHY